MKVDPPPPRGTLMKIPTLVFNDLGLIFFFLSLVLINMPPLIMFTSVLNLHTIAKLLWGIILILNYKHISKYSFRNTLYVILPFTMVLFVSSTSIINTINVFNYMKRYEDIISSGILVFSYLTILNKYKFYKNQIIEIGTIVLIVSSFGNIFIQLITFFTPLYLIKNDNLLPIELTNSLVYNLYRGRVFIQDYTQSFIPLIVFFLTSKKLFVFFQFYLILLIINIIFLSTISNNRSVFLMMIFSLLSLFIHFAQKPLIKLGMTFLTLTLIVLGTLFSQANLKINIFDRFSMVDSSNTEFRKKMWMESAKIGLDYPWTGVGLNNLSFYINKSWYVNESLTKKSYSFEIPPAAFNSHNILLQFFSETGVGGLIVISLTLIVYVISDLSYLKASKKSLKSFLMISFYTTTIFVMFNPTTSIVFWFMFWFYRIGIENYCEESNSANIR